MHTHTHTRTPWMTFLVWMWLIPRATSMSTHTCTQHITHTYAYTHHITHTHIYSCTYAHTHTHPMDDVLGVDVAHPPCNVDEHEHMHTTYHTHICIHTSYHTHIYSCTYAHTHTHTHPMDDVLGVDVAHPPCNVDEHAQYGVQVRDLGRGVEQVSVKRFSQRASVTVLLCEANAQYVRINQNCMQALHNDAAQ